MPAALFRCAANIVAAIVFLMTASNCSAQDAKFAEKHQAIKERLERSNGKPLRGLVHQPPMTKAAASDLGDNEPVIGVALEGEARAYPLTMLFGGGGIFELLNDTCVGQPIAVSW